MASGIKKKGKQLQVLFEAGAIRLVDDYDEALALVGRLQAELDALKMEQPNANGQLGVSMRSSTTQTKVHAATS